MSCQTKNQEVSTCINDLDDSDELCPYLSGWEVNVSSVPRPYQSPKSSLSIQQNSSILKSRVISPEKLPKLTRVPLNQSSHLSNLITRDKTPMRKIIVRERRNLSLCRQNSKSPIYQMSSSLKQDNLSIAASPILYFLPKITVSKAKLLRRC
jgi:hypothetical protein